MCGIARFFPRLSPPSGQSKRNAWCNPAHDDQPRVLSRSDGWHAQRDYRRDVCRFLRGDARELGARQGVVVVKAHESLDAAQVTAQNERTEEKNTGSPCDRQAWLPT